MADVIVLELADEADLPDLQALLKRLAARASCRIVEQKYADGTRCRYGLASFEQVKYAIKAIKKFNQKKLLGVPVTVRQYFHRSYQNERRVLNWRELPWDGPERRLGERRRKLASAINLNHDPMAGILAVETADGLILESK